MSFCINQCPWWGTGGPPRDNRRWGRGGWGLYLRNAIHCHHHKIFFVSRWAAKAELASPVVAGQVFRSCLSARAVITSFPQSVHVLCYQTFLFTVSTCPVLPDFPFHSQYMSCVTRLSFPQSVHVLCYQTLSLKHHLQLLFTVHRFLHKLMCYQSQLTTSPSVHSCIT